MADNMNGKTVLMTGGTEGIGKSAALSLAKMGAVLVLVGRNREKTDRVVADLKAESGNQNITAIYADLSRLEGIRSAAAEFRSRRDRLDVLINNAGGLFMDYQETVDGIEQTFALNHLSYYLLTRELESLLGPGSRVVSTASGAHRSGRFNKSDLRNLVKRPNKSAGVGAYGDSKLANILFTRELARHLQGKGVSVSCFHPGWVSTGFALNNQGFVGNLVGFAAPIFARSPAKGAETLVWLASSPDGAKANGGYYQDLREISPNARGRDDELAAALWGLSEELCASA